MLLLQLLEDVLSKKWWVLFLAYCGFIVWMTLLSRTIKEREFELGLFWGLRMWIDGEPQGWSVVIQYINNIFLFIPFGLFLSGIVEKKWMLVAIIALGSSALIEVTQYITARGLAEVDDVISNMIGAVAGNLLWKCGKKLRKWYTDVR
ncbi:MAG: VanZ family protein [Lachnospiraceae bacterium]|nr:VanZ family protein [Lachnospiraceae bacterium]